MPKIKSRQASEIMAEIAKKRSQAAKAYEYYKSLKNDEDSLRTELEGVMHDEGLGTISTQDGTLTAYFAKRKKMNIYDPTEVAGWLVKNNLNVNDYFKPDSKALQSLANAHVKELHIDPPGISFSENISMSFRENKDKKTAISPLAAREGGLIE